MEKIKGKVIILGDDVDTDQILPGYAMSEPYEEIGKYAMAGLPTEDFKLNREPGCILVAGRNFGCGSSREHAPIAIKASGIQLVIADSFARIFYRNSIDIGLPIIECPAAAAAIADGDEVSVDMDSGVIEDVTTGAKFTAAPLPPFVQEIVRCGGIANYVKKKING